MGAHDARAGVLKADFPANSPFPQNLIAAIRTRRCAAPDFSSIFQSSSGENRCLTLRCGTSMVRRDFEGCGRSNRTHFRASFMAASFEKEGAGEDKPSSLDEFSERLDAMRGEPDKEEEPKGGGAALGRAMRVSTEMLAGILVGTLLGLGLDRWLETAPWFLLLGIALGFAAGLRNLSRSL